MLRGTGWMVVALALGACVSGEPANSPVVQVEIIPNNQQSFSAALERVSITLRGAHDDVRPVLDVLASAEFIDLARGTSIALTPLDTPRDVTYRGAETQWFAFPPVGNGEYEIGVRLNDWGMPLGGTSAVAEGGTWRSRFRLDSTWFFLSGVSVCDQTQLLIQFSEPFASFPESELGARVSLQMNQTAVSCQAAEATDGTVGGFALKLRCGAPIQTPFRITFAPTLVSADGAKPLSGRQAPYAQLTELVVDGAPLVEANTCAGWGAP